MNQQGGKSGKGQQPKWGSTGSTSKPVVAFSTYDKQGGGWNRASGRTPPPPPPPSPKEEARKGGRRRSSDGTGKEGEGGNEKEKAKARKGPSNRWAGMQ